MDHTSFICINLTGPEGLHRRAPTSPAAFVRLEVFRKVLVPRLNIIYNLKPCTLPHSGVEVHRIPLLTFGGRVAEARL